MRYTVIRPLAENEPYLRETLESTFYLDGDYDIYFCVQDMLSPAGQVAVRLCMEHGHAHNATVVTQPDEANFTNPKLRNLHRAWVRTNTEWVITADSNVFLPHDTFRRLHSRWDADTAMVCSPPIGAKPDTFWAEVECAFLNTFQAKWQVLADKIGLGFCQGKIMLVRKDEFDSFGGLEVLDLWPAEDAAATKVIRSHDKKIRLSKLFSQWLGPRTFKQVWDRQLRWAKLRRKTFPVYYALEIAISLAVNLAFLVIWPQATLWFMLFWYLGEWVMMKACGWHASWRMLIAIMVRDALFLPLWVMGWFGDEIVWSGNHLSLETTK